MCFSISTSLYHLPKLCAYKHIQMGMCSRHTKSSCEVYRY